LKYQALQSYIPDTDLAWPCLAERYWGYEICLKITIRVIGYCFASVILSVGLYCLLPPLALNYDGPTTTAFLKRMLVVGLLADVLCTYRAPLKTSVFTNP